MRILVTCLGLFAVGSGLLFTACSDDEPAGAAPSLDGAVDGSEGGGGPPDEDLVDPPPPAAACDGLALPTVSGECASCLAARCCAQATACSTGDACQKVIDCIDNCTRHEEAVDAGGDKDEGGDDVDAGVDAGEPDASEDDAGEHEADAGGGGVSTLEACIAVCTAPLNTEVSALAALTACETVNCSEECPVAP